MSSVKAVNRVFFIRKGLRHSPLSQCTFRNFSTKSLVDENESFATNIFIGRMPTKQLFPFPKVLSEDQTDTLRQMVEPSKKFFSEINDASKNDLLEDVPPEVMKGLADLGAFGLLVPESYGGVGLTNTQYARMAEVSGAYDLGLSIVLGAHQSIGYKGILLFGDEKMKTKYLPDLCAGKKLAAFCLTESSSGSDASSIQTKAVKSADGKHYILNGSKQWISNGGIADIFTVFAKLKMTDSNGIEKEKITAFIVDRSFGGVTNGPPEKKMGIRCSNTASLYLEDCKVPVENVLGGEGNGFKTAMNILNNGRFGMAAGMSGTMRSCIATAAAHAAERSQFGSKLSSFSIIQEKLATMACRHYITESMTYMISGLMDQGIKDCQMEAAISKVYGSEAAWYCTDEAIQILGGNGFMHSTGLERVMRDLRVFRIFEGTNDILRLFIALMGMQFAGKAVQQVNVMLDVARTKAKRTIGIGSSPLKSECHADLQSSAVLCAGSVGLLGESVLKLLRLHRKDVIKRQIELCQVANAAMEIYGMATSLSRCSQTLALDLPTKQFEKRLVELICRKGSETVEHGLSGIASGEHKASVALQEEIGLDVVASGGVVSEHILGF